MRTCETCHEEKDVRPYGANGALICFDCMKADPEREREAKRQFMMQLNACGPLAVIGEETGPRPLKKGTQ